MAIIKLKKSVATTLTITATGDSDVYIIEEDVVGLMVTSHGTFSATSTSAKTSNNLAAQTDLSHAAWKAWPTNLAAGSDIGFDAWTAIHFETVGYSSGTLTIDIKPY